MPRHRATAGSYGGGGSDERGTPVARYVDSYPATWTRYIHVALQLVQRRSCSAT